MEVWLALFKPATALCNPTPKQGAALGMDYRASYRGPEPNLTVQRQRGWVQGSDEASLCGIDQ
jgi:hypothetical protein